MLNSLERWLRRAPLEPVQQQSNGQPDASITEPLRSQQTAAPPSSNEQEQEAQQQRKATSGTLDGFVTRKDDIDSDGERHGYPDVHRRRRRRLVG